MAACSGSGRAPGSIAGLGGGPDALDDTYARSALRQPAAALRHAAAHAPLSRRSALFNNRCSPADDGRAAGFRSGCRTACSPRPRKAMDEDVARKRRATRQP